MICLVNYSNEARKLQLAMREEWEVKKIHYGNETSIDACDAVIMELECKNK